MKAYIKLDESLHGVVVVIPTNDREIPGSPLGRYNLQIKITSVGDHHGQETGLNVTSTPAEKRGPSAQDRYCARSFGGGAKKRRANEKE